MAGHVHVPSCCPANSRRWPLARTVGARFCRCQVGSNLSGPPHRPARCPSSRHGVFLPSGCLCLSPRRAVIHQRAAPNPGAYNILASPPVPSFSPPTPGYLRVVLQDSHAVASTRVSWKGPAACAAPSKPRCRLESRSRRRVPPPRRHANGALACAKSVTRHHVMDFRSFARR